MTAQTVTIIETGIANTASVTAALNRLGCDVVRTDSATTVADAPLVVLPGVGSFAAGMAKLRAANLVDPIRERIAANRPTLCICLGMQLLFASSDESPGVEGLAIIDQHIARFPDTVRVPQFGWNKLTPDPSCTLIQPGYAYFANSYRATLPPPGWSCATATHDAPFIAAMERGPILANQFHPELSGQCGLALLERWTQTAKAGAPC